MTRTHDMEPPTRTDHIQDDGYDDEDREDAQKSRRFRRIVVLLAGGAIALGGGGATYALSQGDSAPTPHDTQPTQSGPITPGTEQGPTAPETEATQPADIYLDGQGMTIEQYVAQRNVSAEMINQPPEIIAQAFFDKVFLPAANANADHKGYEAHQDYVSPNKEQSDTSGFPTGASMFNDDLLRNQIAPVIGMDGGYSKNVLDKIRDLNEVNIHHSGFEGANRSTSAEFDFSNSNVTSSTNMNGEKSGTITFVVKLTSALEQDPNYNDVETLKFNLAYRTQTGNPNLIFDGTNIDENSADTKIIS